MKISDRDKKLIFIMLIACVIALPIVFVIKPVKEKTDGVNNEIQTLTDRFNYLFALNEHRQDYLDSIDVLNSTRDEIVADFAKGIKQENSIMFYRNIELNNPFRMKLLNFSTGDNIQISEDYINENGENVEGLTAISYVTSINFEASYDEFKSFLQTILDNPERTVVNAVSASKFEDGLQGTVTVTQFAITGEGRELAPAVIPSMEHGNECAFGSFDLIIDETEDIVEEEVEEE